MKRVGRRARPSLGERAGITLVELLVALVSSGLLAAIVFQFLNGQTRFVNAQMGRQEVQQNARVALDLIASELRGVSPVSGGIVHADRDSITFRQPRAYGVLCQQGGAPLQVMFAPDPGLDLDPNTATGLMVRTEPNEWTVLFPVGAAGVAAQTDAAADCGVGLNTSLPEGDRVARSFTGPGGLESNLPPGTPVYLFDRVRYRRKESGSGRQRRNWLGRSNGILGVLENGRMDVQPFAGPLQADGLRFAYFAENSDTPLPTPVPEPDLGRIRRIRLVVAVESGADDPDRRQSETDSVLILLRN